MLSMSISAIMLGVSINGVKRSFPDGRSVLSGRTRQRQFGPGDGALDEDLAAEAIELGRAAAGLGRDRASLLNEALLIDEAPEILLVEAPPGKRLDGTL